MKQKIVQTTNYSLFNKAGFNRDVNDAHVAKLMKSIKDTGYIVEFPIIVDSNYTIVDGQHRFEACKRLGLPIYYTQAKREFTASDIININSTQKSWSLLDRIKSLANNPERNNRDEYAKLLAYISNNADFPITFIIGAFLHSPQSSMFGGSSSLQVLDENFKFEKPSNLDSFLDFHRKVKKSVTFRNNRFYSFTTALWTAYNDVNFKEQYFMDIVADIRARQTYTGFKEEIQYWYNYRKRSGKINIVDKTK